MLDKFKGYRTVAFNLLALVTIVAHENGYVFEDYDDEMSKFAPFVLIAVNLALRFLTKTPALKRSID